MDQFGDSESLVPCVSLSDKVLAAKQQLDCPVQIAGGIDSLLAKKVSLGFPHDPGILAIRSDRFVSKAVPCFVR